MAYWRYDELNGKWNEIPATEKNDNDIKLEPRLINVLDHAKKDLKNDLDFAMIIFGSVGSGKSTLGRLCCRYVADEDFNPRDHMIRDVNDIEGVIGNAKNGQAIVFDEASGIFASTDTTTKKTKYANYVLDVCRQKNLFIVIIAPGFHRLGPTVAMERTKIALRTFIDKKTQQRGKFAFYGTRKKAELYHLAKKNFGSIKGVGAKWHGEFGMEMTHDAEYRRVKDETLQIALESFGGKKKPKEEKSKPKPKTPLEIERDVQKNIVRKNPEMTAIDLAKILDCSYKKVCQLRKELKEEIADKIFADKFINNNNVN